MCISEIWWYIHIMQLTLHRLIILYLFRSNSDRIADATMNNAMNNLAAQQQAEFDAILIRIGFSPEQREAVIDTRSIVREKDTC